MRYSVYLPEIKGGYKLDIADRLEEAICKCHTYSQKHRCECIIYDSILKTADVRKMIKNAINENNTGSGSRF